MLFSRIPYIPRTELLLSEESGHLVPTLKWHSFKGGLVEIGYPPSAENPLDFCFDNETPRHKVYLDHSDCQPQCHVPRILEFMSDDAYTRPGLWLSDGWEMARQAGLQAPLYWERDASDETGWRVFTLRGWHGLSVLLDTPVCHISFFEADAFARWRGCRLPTEAEWESVATNPSREICSTREAASRNGER